jgi:hypothetical protein
MWDHPNVKINKSPTGIATSSLEETDQKQQF